MTNEQAIEILTDLRYFDDDCDTDVDAINVGIKALEKQIPQKPNPPTDKYHADTCAVCGGEVVTEQRFCGNCGQAISWEGGAE